MARAGEYNPDTGEFDDDGYAEAYGEGAIQPCQPIGCDAGIHLAGCRIQQAQYSEECPMCHTVGHSDDCPIWSVI